MSKTKDPCYSEKELRFLHMGKDPKVVLREMLDNWCERVNAAKRTEKKP